MPWYLILTAGLILGALADRALIVLGDYLPGRPVNPAQKRPVGTTPKRYGAAAILGYHDGGSRYIAPTHPVTRGARNPVAALAAWDRRDRQDVA